MHYFLGIDIGTTHTKAVLLSGAGIPVFETRQGYELLRPQPGYEEQDVAVIMEAVTRVIGDAVAAAPQGHAPAAIGFSAAMHSLLPVDTNGDPLYNALTWADTRSAQEAEELKRHPGAAGVYSNTGIPFHPMSPLCKIVWFRKHRPDIFEKAAKFISIKEYVLFRLLGKYIVDYSVAAATGLFSIRENNWDAQALQLAGIDAQKLSQPVPATHCEYELATLYSHLAGNNMISFVAGASDGCLANFGSGAVEHGQTALTIGTSGAVRMTVRLPAASPDHLSGAQGLFTYPLTGDLYVRGGAINNGGIVLKWLSSLFLQAGQAEEESYAELLALAARAPAGANGLVFLPYLLGERAPVWDAGARGAFVGLTMNHGRADMVRAALEGICFSLGQLIALLEKAHGPVQEIYASGGFTRSAFWLQLLADITGKPMRISSTADASAAGAAFLAMLATGHLKDPADVRQWIQAGELYYPDPGNRAVYARLSGVFNSLYPKLKDEFAVLSI
ncbi:MAG: gluconokinase [Chitinophagaceae bacterium]